MGYLPDPPNDPDEAEPRTVPFPEVTAGRGAYALVGMGAVVAGATRAPITAILIIFELTSDYHLIVPLMASCIIATLVTSRFRRTTIYTEKLMRRGIDVAGVHDVNILRGLRVDGIMDTHVVTVRVDAPLGKLLEKMEHNPHSILYVAGDDGEFLGTIGLADLQHAFGHAKALSQILLAVEFMRSDTPILTPGQQLDSVMHIFAEHHPELSLRARLGVQVLLVRRPVASNDPRTVSTDLIPGPDTVLAPGDRLVVMGNEKALAKLQTGG